MNWLGPVSAAMLGIVSLPLANQITGDEGRQPVDLLKLKTERFQRMTVPVTIDQQGPFNFMIDTGAQATLVSSQLADQLGLSNRTPATLVAMASKRPIETTSIPNLRLGSRSFDIQTAPIIDRANIGSADGVLGLDSLQGQRVLLDFDKNRIAVADADELGGNRGYDIVVKARRKLGQLIITGARFENVRVAVIIDTGAQGSVGNEALRRRLRGQKVGPALMTDINGVQVDGHVRLARSIQVGGVSLNNIPITFVDSPTFAALGLDREPALVLGMEELRLFRRVAIDFGARKVLFDTRTAFTKSDAIIGADIGL